MTQTDKGHQQVFRITTAPGDIFHVAATSLPHIQQDIIDTGRDAFWRVIDLAIGHADTFVDGYPLFRTLSAAPALICPAFIASIELVGWLQNCADSDQRIRASGRTTRQIERLPHAGVFVWCNENTDYPRRCAERIGREDVEIWPLHALKNPERWRGHKFTGIDLDHAVWDQQSGAKLDEIVASINDIAIHCTPAKSSQQPTTAQSTAQNCAKL